MTVRSYPSPGALQPKYGGSGVRDWISPGAIQPQIKSALLVPKDFTGGMNQSSSGGMAS